MTLIVSGGNIVDKIPIWRDDFTEYKYELEDSFDNSYELYQPFSTVQFEKEMDNENSLFAYIRYHDIIEKSFNEIVNVRTDGKYHYFVLHYDYDLYRCDQCSKKYLDYMEMYLNASERKESVLTYSDLCYECYKKHKREVRKESFKVAQQTMHENQTAPTSSQQKYISNLLGGILNKPIENFFADIVLEKDKIVIEYDGSGHFMRKHFGNITENELRRNDFIRDKIIQKKGYKVIRIESSKDYLPSDDEIVDIVNRAKKIFDNGKSYFYLNVDDEYDTKDLRKVNKNTLKETLDGSS